MANLSINQALKMAAVHAKRGEILRAAALYKAILTAVPNHKTAKDALEELRPWRDGSSEPSPADIQELTDLFNSRKFSAAIFQANQLTEYFPRSFFAWNVLGASHASLGEMALAIKSLKKVVELNPNYADGHSNLAAALQQQGMLHEALDSCKRALRLKPDYPEAYNNLGATLRKLGNLDEAAKCYQNATKLKPDYAEAHNSLGNVRYAMGRLNEAVASYQQALKHKPDYAAAYSNLGLAFKEQVKFDQALACYQKALLLEPYDVVVEARIFQLRQSMCDFSSCANLHEALGRFDRSSDVVPPFGALSWEDNGKRQLFRSRKWAKSNFKKPSQHAPSASTQSQKRLRVGYFSSDFFDHATLYLILGLLREHDKAQFEVHAYSYGFQKMGDWGKKAVAAVEYFHDVADYSDEKLIELVRSHNLDIAIDLKGYTGGTRSDLFQHRLAPIQVNFLGYPGSIGADFIDYIIADPVVIPKEKRQFYSEKVLYLPHSYQPNDDTREIAQVRTTRSDFGLPEDGFVFCCFNNNYKISTREFDIWIQLLKDIEGSVFWLAASNRWAVENLREEAERRAVDHSRLIFAEHLPQTMHLARHKHADLFLDTFNYNAHTTASDALWSGLPIITKKGEQFAARVAASLLTAVGLPELIVDTEDAYMLLAHDLANHPRRLASIRKKLADNITKKPLFDTKRYTLNFEHGLKQVFEIHLTGQEPKDIWILEAGQPIS
ncbi:tetratricopeptide repeat protein [Rhodobacterales bacterium HKCCSP123]|nr:tetratricopeptide repeat protein [Rhodobacterales bacterium HKCCSP123]